jgi:hypothetical protein
MRRRLLAALLIAGAACGASTFAQEAAPCQSGTVASYAGTTCSQGTVIYTFPRDFYSYSGSGVHSLAADAIHIRMDPQGPFTFLIGFTNWNLDTPGESFEVTLHFSVRGADKLESWMHGCYTTDGGEVSGSITVNTHPPVTSTAICNSEMSRERTRDETYPAGPVEATVTIKAKSGDGTAGLRSFGTHFKP